MAWYYDKHDDRYKKSNRCNERSVRGLEKLGTRLSSQNGVKTTSGVQFAALPPVDKDFELHGPSSRYFRTQISRQQEI